MRTLDDRPGIYENVRHKPILTTERMLHKDYDRNGSVEKISLVVSLKGLGAKTN
jgi:hypothetical protein